jgi:mannosyltransferase OCH1-like enzyme
MKSVIYKKPFLLSVAIAILMVGSLSTKHCTEFADIFIPFPSAMEGHPYMNAIATCDTKSEWQLIKRLYTQYLVDDLDWSEKPRIPKVVHHIWLGSPLPEKCRILRETWMRNHPDWEFKLWTDSDVEAFGLENKALFDASNNWGEKSDIWRYEIIYRYGGLYVDTDFESIRPMDVLHHSLDFYAGIYTSQTRGSSPSVVMGMGMIGAIPNHPIMRALIDGLKNAQPGNGTSSAILARTGPYYFTKVVLANAGKGNLRNTILPPQFVYPTPIAGRGCTLQEQHKKYVKHSTFANHVWHMSWIKGCSKKK